MEEYMKYEDLLFNCDTDTMNKLLMAVQQLVDKGYSRKSAEKIVVYNHVNKFDLIGKRHDKTTGN